LSEIAAGKKRGAKVIELSALKEGQIKEWQMLSRSKRHPLLDHPFLSESETLSLLQDVDAAKEGRIPGIVGSDLWYRALAEIARLQHVRETKISRSLTCATWVLVLATWALAIVSLISRSR